MAKCSAITTETPGYMLELTQDEAEMLLEVLDATEDLEDEKLDAIYNVLGQAMDEAELP